MPGRRYTSFDGLSSFRDIRSLSLANIATPDISRRPIPSGSLARPPRFGGVGQFVSPVGAGGASPSAKAFGTGINSTGTGTNLTAGIRIGGVGRLGSRSGSGSGSGSGSPRNLGVGSYGAGGGSPGTPTLPRKGRGRFMSR
jgi:hypothetical protein